MNGLSFLLLLLNGNSLPPTTIPTAPEVPTSNYQPQYSSTKPNVIETPYYNRQSHRLTPQERIREQHRLYEQRRQQARNQENTFGLHFRPTPLSVFGRPEAPPIDTGNTKIREYLSFGFSRLVEGCDHTRRTPCNGYSVSRYDCERWKCCWDPSHPVRCAKNTYYITRLATGPDFSICGVQREDLLDSVTLRPAFSSLSPLSPLILTLIRPRIVGGQVATDGDSPWVVYIYEFTGSLFGGGLCGGTLLTTEWIVTAAHCFATIDPTLYGVVLGEHTISATSGREVFRDVDQLIINPSFNTNSFDFDVALIKMSQPVTFGKYIRPACLVPSGTPTDSVDPPSFAGRICTTFGWGFISSSDAMRQDRLMRLDLPIIPNDICNAVTTTSMALYDNKPVDLGDPKFCAGGNMNQDSCDGDSGGPLVCLHDDGFYYLHGVTSYGTLTCANGLLPGVYTKLANLYINNWIRSNTGLTV